MINSTSEREQFSTRLRQVLNNTYGFDRPCALAREFNRHFTGGAITVYAARKWLLGQAIPTQSKLRALAHWLGVSPEWLRYGEAASAPGLDRAERARLKDADMMLIAELEQLAPHHRRMAAGFVRMLLVAQARRDEPGTAATPPGPGGAML